MPESERAATELQAEILRGLSAAQRLQIALQMTDLVRDLSRAGLRARHPAWSEREISRELLRYAFLPESLPGDLP